jgi:hypothetical protein
VSYGGARFIIGHIGETLLYIQPKANKRGYVLLTGKEEKSRHCTEIRGLWYSLDPCANIKTCEALLEIINAWELGASREAVYKIVGGLTTRCAMCGCELTDPLSMSRGIGPDCWQTIYANDTKQRVRRSRLTL